MKSLDRVKIAKKLLKLGADFDSIDNKGRRPIDIATQKHFRSMEDLLKDETNSIQCSYTIKQPKSGVIYPLSFLGFFLIKEFFTVFTISFYVDSNRLILLSITAIIVLFMLSCILIFHSPSLEKRKVEKNLLTLSLLGECLKNICAYCNIRKTNTTNHCYYCNKCIEKYDHHCIWLSNCIGKHNIFTFRVFLLWIIFKIMINMMISFKSKKNKNNKKFIYFTYNIIYNKKFYLMINLFVSLLIGLFNNKIIEYSFEKSVFPFFEFFTNKKFKQIISSLDLISGVIVLIPVL